MTALWLLETKTLIPMVNPTGRLKLLFRVERRAVWHGTIRDEALIPLWTPQRKPEIYVGPGENPEIPASTPDENLSPGSDCRGIPRGPLRLALRLYLPEAPLAGP